ncbi:MAG: flagellar FlbD family protein [Oscillospiraceae bacterium]
MIVVTKLNDTPFILNDDLIETIEETPDTTIRLTNKNYIIVKESMMEVVARVIAFRKEINGTITLHKTFSDISGNETPNE